MSAPQPLPAAIRHLILDRDGVLNQEAPGHGYILRPEDFRWLPGSLQALVQLASLGMCISVATNQSAVGRGLMTLAQLEQILARRLFLSARARGALRLSQAGARFATVGHAGFRHSRGADPAGGG